jgi:hypothetical protein
MSQLMLLVAAFLCLGFVFVILAIRNRKAFNAFEKRFPPISDLEFLTLCPPGTNPEIALKVRRIVAEQLGVKYDCIYPSSRFVEDLHAD